MDGSRFDLLCREGVVNALCLRTTPRCFGRVTVDDELEPVRRLEERAEEPPASRIDVESVGAQSLRERGELIHAEAFSGAPVR